MKTRVEDRSSNESHFGARGALAETQFLNLYSTVIIYLMFMNSFPALKSGEKSVSLLGILRCINSPQSEDA